MQDAYAHCETLVREADKDRFLAGLFAPQEPRRHLFALYAFNVEVSRVREVAREVLPGEIRLQWWSDALTGTGHGSIKANPVAAALMDTIARLRLPVEPLLELIEARRFDIYDEPMASLADLDAYARKTSSGLIGLAAHILLGDGDAGMAQATLEAGIAYAITGLLRAFPRHAARHRLYVPLDILDRHDLTPEEMLAGGADPRVIGALADMRRHAREHLSAFDELRAGLLPAAGPAFLPVALVPPALDCLEKGAADPYAPAELPQWRRQWILWRAARKGYPGR